MDPNPPDPLDARLHAWFDGELPPDESAAVEALLRERPDLAERVRGWAADREALRARFAPVLDELVPARLARAARHGALTLPRWAAAVAVFLLGGATGAGLVAAWSPRPPAVAEALSGDNGAWARRAFVAHAVYAPEQRHPVEVTVAENRDNHLARWLTRRLAVPVKLFDLGAFGFELVGGRLLPDAAGPSAQLMYQNSAGERVTVYLRKPDPGPADQALAAFRYERQGGLGMFYWIERSDAAASADAGEPRTGYALVGNLPRERLLAIAEAIYRQGREATP